MAKVRKSIHELFEEHYQGIWGERWPALKAALLLDPQKVKISNPFEGKAEIFELDAASLVPPKDLDGQPGERVLDLCAAPGGKSLMMLFQTKGKIKLTVNELSKTRFQRLKAVFYDYLPEEIVQQIDFSCADGARFCLSHREEFDRVLVDAPCSGERHLLKAQDLKDWTPSRSKQLSVRQHSLLCAAMDACKAGGRVVYSTCAISPLENDRVIQKLLKSRKGQFQVLESESSELKGERTEFGKIYLPDVGAAGPIYSAILQKVESNLESSNGEVEAE